MADRIRFHLDEHVDPAIATALRRAGIDVTPPTKPVCERRTTKPIFNSGGPKVE
jgi:hypothetical protein